MSSRSLETLDLGGHFTHQPHPVAGVAAFENPDRLIGFTDCRIPLSRRRLSARQSLCPNLIGRHLGCFTVSKTSGGRESHS
jgi:hypothetical protein